MSTSPSACSPFDFESLGPATLQRTSAYRLTSEAIGQDFLIEVSLPPVPVQPGQHLPVVYVLDGNHGFAMTAQIARMLQYGPYPLPPTLVVGIGYHLEDPDEGHRPGILRMRDLTPCNDETIEARLRAAPAPWGLPPDISFGGGAAFLEFIETQVKPFVASGYPVDAQDQTLLGMSAGGLFALYALFSRPEAFKRYVVMSPALHWADRRLFELEAALAERTKDLPIHLFLGVGGLEETHDVASKLVSNLYELESRLRGRAYPGLHMGFHVFPDETHMSVYPAGVSRGLSHVFGGPGDVSDWSKALRR